MGFHRNPLPGLESVRDFEWICRGGRVAQKGYGREAHTRSSVHVTGRNRSRARLRPGARWAAPGRRVWTTYGLSVAFGSGVSVEFGSGVSVEFGSGVSGVIGSICLTWVLIGRGFPSTPVGIA